jgi:hypothetical protein
VDVDVWIGLVGRRKCEHMSPESAHRYSRSMFDSELTPTPNVDTVLVTHTHIHDGCMMW